MALLHRTFFSVCVFILSLNASAASLDLATKCQCFGQTARCQLSLTGENVWFKQGLRVDRDSPNDCQVFIARTQQFSGTHYEVSESSLNSSKMVMSFATTDSAENSCTYYGEYNFATTECSIGFVTLISGEGEIERAPGSPNMNIQGSFPGHFDKSIAVSSILSTHNFFGAAAVFSPQTITFIRQL